MGTDTHIGPEAVVAAAVAAGSELAWLLPPFEATGPLPAAAAADFVLVLVLEPAVGRIQD